MSESPRYRRFSWRSLEQESTDENGNIGSRRMASAAPLPLVIPVGPWYGDAGLTTEEGKCLMAGSDVVYVTLDSNRYTEPKVVVEKVAKILNKDVFAVRVLLNGKIPKVAGHYPDVPTAESIAQDLRSLGYQVIMCRDSELRQRSPGGSGPTPCNWGNGMSRSGTRVSRLERLRREACF